MIILHGKREDEHSTVISRKISADSPVCGAFIKEVSRSLAAQIYISRWVKNIIQYYYVLFHCVHEIIYVIEKATSEELKMTLQ